MISENTQECQNILDKLLSEEKIEPFLTPVVEQQPEIKEIYFKQISQPMDLGTISDKLKQNEYKNTSDFAEDVRLVFLNTMQFTFYNDPLHKNSKKLLGLFETLWLKSDISKQVSFDNSLQKKRKRIKSEEVMKKFKETTVDFILTEIYNSLESPKESEEVKPIGLNYDLYRYQVNSLEMMYERETKPREYPDPLWEELSPNLYEHVINGQQTTSRPMILDSRGGLLCEEMGAGKTLIVISLIVKTKGCWASHPMSNEEPKPKSNLFEMCYDFIKENEIDYFNRDIPNFIKESLYQEKPKTIQIQNTRSRKTRKGIEFKTLKLSRTTLVIVPPHLLKQWMSEFKKFTSKGCLTIHKIQTEKEILSVDELLTFDVVICTQSMFTKTDLILKPFYQIKWFRVIIDEGHILGKTSTRQTIAMKELICDRRWICTGTPTPKSNIELELKILHGLVDFINHEPFSEKQIWERYILEPFLEQEIVASNRLKELLKRIMIRTRKEDFDISIPSCHINVIKLNLQPFEINRYNEQIVQLKTNIITSREEGVDYIFHSKNRKYAKTVWDNLLKSSFFMAGLDKEQRALCQIAIEDELKKDDVSNSNFSELLNILPVVKDYKKYPLNNSIPWNLSTKLVYLLNRLKEIAPKEKCIIFTQFNEIAANILEALDKEKDIKFVEYHQKYNIAKRSKNLNLFETDNSVRVIVMNIGLAAYGLNVVKASRIFIVDPILDKSIETQAIKRAHRIGQKNEVIVEKLICENTLDELIHLESEKHIKSEDIIQKRKLMKSLQLMDKKENHFEILKEMIDKCKNQENSEPLVSNLKQKLVSSGNSEIEMIVENEPIIKSTQKKKVSFMF
eukprot:gene3171-5487_t